MIKVNHLQFNYGRSCVYDDFSLELTLPGIYGLFGRNGSGKSTLLKILSGLLFSRSGIVEVLGFRPSDRAPTFLEQVYFVPEEFHLPNITLEVLASIHSTFYPHFSNSDFQRYIQIFEIPQGKNFAAMSLGQKKKAVIAFALATHTPLLLMDEPTNGLDIVGRTQFKNILSGDEHKNRLVIISTHQAHDLESLMNHVLFFDEGKIALSASTSILQRALTLGVADNKDTIKNSIYCEAIGDKWAYIAANTHEATGSLNLELLYKALSMNKQGIINAVADCQTQQGEPRESI